MKNTQRIVLVGAVLFAGTALSFAQPAGGPPKFGPARGLPLPPPTRLQPQQPPPPPQPLQPPPPPPLAPPPTGPGQFGQPLARLNGTELNDFNAGLAAFDAVQTPTTGLGPIFNNVSCVACHSVPSPGGASTITVTRFGRTTNGVFDPLTQLDGSLLHARAIAPALQELIPAAANTIAHRLTTPLYGAGLIEAIPDSTILLNATPRGKPPGVGGRAAVVTDAATGQLRVGRFGWKAQHATLLSFAGDASTNEIGITNRIFPVQPAPNGNVALLAQFVNLNSGPKDKVNPVTGKGAIDREADYMRYLAPPAPGPRSPGAVVGQQYFSQVGCASCHTPSMNTGTNAIAALSNVEVFLYSDLLLHNMGTLGDGFAQGPAGPTEMRTSPLWGLRTRPTYLHDGRARTLDAAIRAHDGEGAVSTGEYNQLSPVAQQQLLEFLDSL